MFTRPKRIFLHIIFYSIQYLTTLTNSISQYIDHFLTSHNTLPILSYIIQYIYQACPLELGSWCSFSQVNIIFYYISVCALYYYYYHSFFCITICHYVHHSLALSLLSFLSTHPLFAPSLFFFILFFFLSILYSRMLF